jgi:oxamate amidohydrolase
MALYKSGAIVAPHFQAAEVACEILKEGGNAIEAMVAAAAAIAVVYPHMTAIGGDAFWLIHESGKNAPRAIDACGRSFSGVTMQRYKEAGLEAVPTRGVYAANTVAGTVSGWQAALELAQYLGGTMPLSALLEPAINLAATGITVTRSQFAATSAKQAELSPQTGFSDAFLVERDGKKAPPKTGERFVMPRLAATFEQLSRAGLGDFYTGDISVSIANDFAKISGLLTRQDLLVHRAKMVDPLQLRLQRTAARATIFNMTPPTQGVISMLILAIVERVFEKHGVSRFRSDNADTIHVVVEATKLAFAMRDKYITDPLYMQIAAPHLLENDVVSTLAAKIKLDVAAPWGKKSQLGDTVWMGAVDSKGCAVSFIQSIYHEFGSGIVLPETGINWQNRGASFSMDEKSILRLAPDKQPFHTLNPALAHFDDGSVMPYGTMGGDGQPQTQAAVFLRIAYFGLRPQDAIAAPRWLLGRSWGNQSDTLKIEKRYSQEVFDTLVARGHDVEWLADFDESVGHAGALIAHANGTISGGFDPRSDGAVVGY